MLYCGSWGCLMQELSCIHYLCMGHAGECTAKMHGDLVAMHGGGIEMHGGSMEMHGGFPRCPCIPPLPPCIL